MHRATRRAGAENDRRSACPTGERRHRQHVGPLRRIRKSIRDNSRQSVDPGRTEQRERVMRGHSNLRPRGERTLLDVLNLLFQSIDVPLDFHDMAGDRRVVALRADGVGLTE